LKSAVCGTIRELDGMENYIFWHDHKPLTLIYEVFSPYLSKYLGEMSISGL
jgi:hypothetical protein